MQLNENLKCPKCSSFDLDRAYFSSQPYMTCRNCNTPLGFTKDTVMYSWLVWLVVVLLGAFVETIPLKLIFYIVAWISMMCYLELYGKIEIYIPVKPAYDFNLFIDNLRNSK